MSQSCSGQMEVGRFKVSGFADASGLRLHVNQSMVVDGNAVISTKAAYEEALEREYRRGLSDASRKQLSSKRKAAVKKTAKAKVIKRKSKATKKKGGRRR